MAKSSTRRVTIYINGKEVEASVKQIRAEMNRLVNEQNRMVIGSDEYIAHAKKIKELRQYLKAHAQEIGSAASAWSEMYNKVLQFGTGIGGLTQILSFLDNVTSTLKQVATDLATMDDVYSDVIKTTGMTREQVEELNESFKNLDTRTSREQLNNLAYIAGKLGISSKELVQHFVEAADIINVSMGDVLGDDATLAIGKMVDVYKKSTDMLAGDYAGVHNVGRAQGVPVEAVIFGIFRIFAPSKTTYVRHPHISPAIAEDSRRGRLPRGSVWPAGA